MRPTRLHTLALAGLALAGLLAAAPAARAQETTVRTTVREAGSPGWLGIAFDWDAAAPEQMRITQVFPGSPATAAGVRRGDVVVRIGDRAATSAAMAEVRTRLAPGDTVRLRVRRDGAERDVALVAGTRPAPQVFADRVLRMRGDTLPGGVRVFRRDSAMAGVNVDSLVRMDHEGRDIVIRLRGDSLRAVADSLLFRVDTLRRRVRIRGEGGEARVFTFPLPDSLTREQRTAMEEMVRLHRETFRRDGVTMRDGAPYFFEVGRRALAGAELVPMNEGLARYFSTREGVLVTRVSPSSPAGRAGLEAGDVVVRAGGRAVTTVEEVRESVRRAEGGRVPLEIVRGRGRRTLELRWEAARPGESGRVEVISRPAPRRGGEAQR